MGEEIIKELPVPKTKLIIFSAEWCKYCQYLKKDLPSFDLSKYEVDIVDVDKEDKLSKKYKIKSLPTSIIIDHNNLEKSRIKGYEKNKYLNWLKNQ